MITPDSHFFSHIIPLRYRTSKILDVGIEPLARPFARSLIPLTPSLAPHSSLRLRARLHSFVCLRSLTLELVGKWVIECPSNRLFWTISRVSNPLPLSSFLPFLFILGPCRISSAVILTYSGHTDFSQPITDNLSIHSFPLLLFYPSDPKLYFHPGFFLRSSFFFLVQLSTFWLLVSRTKVLLPNKQRDTRTYHFYRCFYTFGPTYCCRLAPLWKNLVFIFASNCC